MLVELLLLIELLLLLSTSPGPRCPSVTILPFTLSFLSTYPLPPIPCSPHLTSLLPLFPLCNSLSPFRQSCLANSFPSAISLLCHFMRRFRQLRLPNPFIHRSCAYIIITFPLPHCAPFAVISRTFYPSLAY